MSGESLITAGLVVSLGATYSFFTYLLDTIQVMEEEAGGRDLGTRRGARNATIMLATRCGIQMPDYLSLSQEPWSLAIRTTGLLMAIAGLTVMYRFAMRRNNLRLKWVLGATG